MPKSPPPPPPPPYDQAQAQRDRILGGGRKPSEEEVARTVTGAMRAAGSAFRVLLFLALLVVSLVVTTFIPIIGGLMLFALALVALTAR